MNAARAPRPISELEAESSRLHKEIASEKLDIEVLRKATAYFAKGGAVRYAWIDDYRDQYSVTRLCQILGVSRNGYCQWRVRPPSARTLTNAALDAEIAAIHRTHRGADGRPRSSIPAPISIAQAASNSASILRVLLPGTLPSKIITHSASTLPVL